MSFIRAYLRASTSQQDANRARQALQRFASERGLKVAAWYVENESGATLARPELLRLLDDSSPGDVLLVEQVDRLSRLTAADWDTLKDRMAAKRVRVVALDLPTSWQGAVTSPDEVTQGLLDAVNRMLLDVLAVVARKDYTDRRRRQAEGIARAKAEGLYRGRRADTTRHVNIIKLLAEGKSWSKVEEITGASRSTILRAVKASRAAEGDQDKA